MNTEHKPSSSSIRLAVMQPYLFPYIGYFQLIKAVDLFVVFDEVNFIKKGWINRNQILLHSKPHLFTLALEKISQNKKICETRVFEPLDGKNKLRDLIFSAYKDAPYFDENRGFVEKIVLNDAPDIGAFNFIILKEMAKYFSIDTRFFLGSEMAIPEEITAENRILAYVKKFKATCYINPIGGVSLYEKEKFLAIGCELRFIKGNFLPYTQSGSSIFVPNLSVLDTLFNIGKNELTERLSNYELIEN